MYVSIYKEKGLISSMIQKVGGTFFSNIVNF